MCLILAIVFIASYFLTRFFCKIFSSPNLKQIHYFRSDDGLRLIYHGVNVCNYSKTAPDFLPWHTKEDYARLKGWGFNLVRFLVFWEAIEPTQGVYNDEYIRQVARHIGMLEELDIKVIIDVHQDVYARKFTGNGFPEWTIHDGDKPFKVQTPWIMNYFQPAVQACLKYFWGSKELKKQYIVMLNHLSGGLAGFKNILGIEVINEPFPPLTKLLTFEKNCLTSFYCDYISNMEGTFRNVFVEPAIYTSTGVPSFLDKVPLSRVINYSPHYYDPFCHENKPYKWWNKVWMRRAIAIKASEAQQLYSPLMIGEFGVSIQAQNYQQYIEDFMDLCDKYGASWCWYCYDKTRDDMFGLLDDDGNPTPLMTGLLRIYPQQIAGSEPKFNWDGIVFKMNYKSLNYEDKETIIFVPEGLEYQVICTSPYRIEGQLIHITNSKANEQAIVVRKRTA